MSRNNAQRSRKPQHKPTNRNGSESARPTARDRVTLRDYVETVTKSGPVRTWADMTPEQRQRILAQLKPSGTR